MPGRTSNPRKQIRELLRHADRLQYKDTDEAFRYTDRALVIADNNRLSAYMGKVRVERFRLWFAIGQFEQARLELQTAEQVFRAEQLSSGLALIENLRGNLCYRQGQIDLARQHYLHSLELDIRPTLSLQQARVHANLGTMCWLLKDYGEALLHFGTCLKFFHAKDYVTEQAIVLQNICMLLQNLGLVDLALELAELNRGLDLAYHQSVVHWNLLRLLGSLWTDKGAFKKAKDYLRKARSGIEASNDQISIAAMNMEFGNFHFADGDLQKAEKYYSLAVSTYDSYGNTIEGTLLHNKLARVYWQRGQHDMAAAHLMRALRIAEDDEDRYDSLTLFAQLHAKAGHPKAQARYAARAKALEKQLAPKPSQQELDELLQKGRALIDDLKRTQA